MVVFDDQPGSRLGRLDTGSREAEVLAQFDRAEISFRKNSNLEPPFPCPENDGSECKLDRLVVFWENGCRNRKLIYSIFMLDRFRFGYSLVGQLLVMIVFITVGNGLFWTTAETTQAEEADFDGAKDQVRFRRPISIESTYLVNRLLVANSTSGSISVPDSTNNVVVSEFDVVNKAGGFIADRSKRFFLLTDVDDGRLHCLQLMADGRIQAQ